jgi:hypothetical protein
MYVQTTARNVETNSYSHNLVSLLGRNFIKFPTVTLALKITAFWDMMPIKISIFGVDYILLKTVATEYFELSVPFYQTTRHHVAENHIHSNLTMYPFTRVVPYKNINFEEF